MLQKVASAKVYRLKLRGDEKLKGLAKVTLDLVFLEYCLQGAHPCIIYLSVFALHLSLK